MPIRVAINGFGRIGRTFYRAAVAYPDLQIVAINDLGDPSNLSYLLKYDSVYGLWEKPISLAGRYLTYYGKKSQLFSEKDPAKLPWAKLKIDVVVESTGRFTDREGARKHLRAGAKRVLISAPAKNQDATLIMGVNHEDFNLAKHKIISMGSCTTNCAAPVVKVLHDTFVVERAQLSTVHAYTATQSLVDGPSGKDLRRGRAAAANIVPSSTGAAQSVVEALPELKGKVDGMAFRVPVLCGSLLDLTAQVRLAVSVDKVNKAFTKESLGKLKGILSVSEEPLVSQDIVGTTFSAIVDTPLTKVTGNLVKVVAWYDNEWAYSCRLADMCRVVGK